MVADGFEVVRGREVRDVRSEHDGLYVRGAEVESCPDRASMISSTACEKLVNDRVADPPGLAKKLVIS